MFEHGCRNRTAAGINPMESGDLSVGAWLASAFLVRAPQFCTMETIVSTSLKVKMTDSIDLAQVYRQRPTKSTFKELQQGAGGCSH